MHINKKSGEKNDCKLNKKLIIVYVYSYVYSIFGNKFYFINETPRKLWNGGYFEFPRIVA